jgi:putative phage-type endonuclease
MSALYNIHNFEQGTSDWLNFRKGKLSASKAATVLGLSPYQTCFQLFEEELGLREPQVSAPHMQAGLEIEDDARQWFFDRLGCEVSPTVVSSKKNPLFIASLDGMSTDGKTILEIKKNNKELHELAVSGKLPSHYNAQVQHQMYVTGLKSCHYLSWRKEPALVVVKRDDVFIEKMVEAELEFKKMLDNLTPPALCERDYEDLSDDMDLEKLVTLYNTDVRALKFLEERVERKKQEIKVRIGDKNAKGNGWRVTRYTIKGRVNYDAIDALKSVDLDLYRKPVSVSFRITVD